MFYSGALYATNQVEDVFLDIDATYEYRDELQLFYDRGIITPDDNGNFNPYELLDRDEFVGISLEVICKRCIQPHTEFQYIEAYKDEDVYYDIDTSNPYFYCVAEADASNYVRGYDPWFQCEDGTQRPDERPFCPNNTITLEEAVAVLLRNSEVFTIEDNTNIINQISQGRITESLSDDITPNNPDGSTYTFYGYFQKALDFQIIEYDSSWNQKTYQMVELIDNKLYPKKSITKEEFLRMAYITLKSSSCSEVNTSDLALWIDIWEKSCEAWTQNCEVSDLNDPDNTYDFTPDVEWFCELWVDDPTGYVWRFYNLDTWTEFFRYGLYLDNIILPSVGEWRVYLTVQDNCGNSAQVYSTIFVGQSPQSLSVDIIADPKLGFKNHLVDFEGVVFWGTAPFEYTWDFWDADGGYGKFIEHLYTSARVFEVLLTVVDAENISGTATVLVKVLEADSCQNDTDGDSINDCDDLCPTVAGDQQNRWCPIVEIGCGENCSCPVGYTCNTQDINSCPTEGYCVPIKQKEVTCLYSPTKTAIFWNASCNSCPCNNFLDFYADLRECDIVFPAITSPDATDIYSRGNLWQIQQ